MSVAQASFCLEGAIRYAAGWFGRTHGDFKEVTAQVVNLENRVLCAVVRSYPQFHPGCFRLSDFNDDTHISQSDAILALKLALEEVDD